MKLRVLLALALGLCSELRAEGAKPLGAQQARNYIGHVIDSLFVPSMHTGRYAQEIKGFVAQSTKELLKTQGVFDKTKNTKTYAAADLYAELNKRVIGFIDHKCKEYTVKELATAAYALTTLQKERIAQSVTLQFHNKVVDILYHEKQLPAGALMSYVGAPLRNKVINAVKAALGTYPK